ncbi:tyrosine-type recombinase/integrase [Kibdelosporangium aridum]|nr:tyrosine-type recombinase/integrase [Kibdelosporangium aridum]
MAELYEVIMGTGMRRGEALALHWTDVRLEDRVLFVRYTLSNVDISRPVFSAPKTRSSYAWIALSDRVVAALPRQRDRQHVQRLTAGGAYVDRDLVFTRRDGQPLRPEYVVRQFHRLTDTAGLPRIRVHDLRHAVAVVASRTVT